MTTVATAVGGIGGNGPGSLTERQVLLGKREELLRTDGASEWPARTEHNPTTFSSTSKRNVIIFIWRAFWQALPTFKDILSREYAKDSRWIVIVLDLHSIAHNAIAKIVFRGKSFWTGGDKIKQQIALLDARGGSFRATDFSASLDASDEKCSRFNNSYLNCYTFGFQRYGAAIEYNVYLKERRWRIQHIGLARCFITRISRIRYCSEDYLSVLIM